MGTRILLVGCGKMGGALLGGWLGGDVTAGDVTVVEPFGGEDVKQQACDEQAGPEPSVLEQLAHGLLSGHSCLQPVGTSEVE